MGFFTFIICLLILLLILIIIGTIQEFTLWVVTRKKHEFVIMIIPALVSLLTFLISIFLTYYILNLFNVNCFEILYSKFMNFEYSFNNFISMILGFVICSIIFIILQALCLKLVNIDYKKIYEFVKYKIFRRKELKELGASSMEETTENSVNLTHNALPAIMSKKTPFFHYIASSLFAFAISFASISGLFYLGIFLGEKYIL